MVADPAHAAARRAAGSSGMNGRPSVRPSAGPPAIPNDLSARPRSVAVVEPDSQQTAKQMRLRYAGSCSVCDADLPAGVKAVYDRSSKTVRCVACVSEAAATGEPVAVNVQDTQRRH